MAVSGGKDSLCLLEFLAKRAKIFRPNFSVEAIHVRMENIHYETDTAYLEDFAAELGVKLHVVTTRFDFHEGCRKAGLLFVLMVSPQGYSKSRAGAAVQ